MKWKIKINEVQKELSQTNIISAQLRKRSLAADEFSIFSYETNFANSGDTIEVFYGELKRFKGLLAFKKIVKSPDGDHFNYVFKGPWQDLTELMYMQSWDEYVDSDNLNFLKAKTRVVLNVDKEKKMISAGNQVEEIINYAKTEGVDIDLKLKQIDSTFLGDEISDITCANAILRTLHWAPDIVGYFDYGANSPTLELCRRKNLDHIDLSYAEIKKFSFCERDDLRLDNVCIIYEKTKNVGDKTYRSSIRDIYPPNSKVGGKKSLVMTVPLNTQNSNIQNNKIETAPIHENEINWWKEKFAFLRDGRINNIKIESVTKKSGLGRELTSGIVFDWMLKNAEKDEIVADISFHINGRKAGTKKCYYRCTATNAPSGNYARTIHSGTEEEIPIGLAQSIFNATNDLQIEGEIKIANADEFELICKKISIANSFENAVVVETNFDIFTRTLSAKFGPPKHLYPADIAQYFRMMKSRNDLSSGKRSSSSVSVEGAAASGAEVIETLDSLDKEISFIELKDSENKNITIRLDINDIKSDKLVEVKLTKTLVVHNGKPMHTYVLMSNPVPIS